MKPLIAINNRGPFQITWLLNHSCPFKCWYCPSEIHNGPNNNHTWEDCNKFINVLLAKFPYAHYSLSGGEPTTWPHFEKLIDKIADSKLQVSIGVNSNLVRTQAWWQRFAPKLSYVAASYHPSVIRTAEERSEWFAKLDSVSRMTDTTVRIMMDPRHWDHCLELFNTLSSKSDLTFTVEPVRLLNFLDGMQAVNYDIEYTEEQSSILETLDLVYKKLDIPTMNNTAVKLDQSIEVTYEDETTDTLHSIAPIVLEKHNQFKNWWCDIGMESLFISERGLLKRGNCLEGEPLGSLQECDNISWPTSAIQCKTDQCHCFTDIRISKWKVVAKKNWFW
jgi:hypothetical protein